MPCSNDSNTDSQQRQEVTVNSVETDVIHEARKRKQPTLVACLERGSSFEGKLLLIIILRKQCLDSVNSCFHENYNV